MALSHVFSSPIADFTGTVTVFNSAGVTTTANATDVVRPSNWNSVHNEYMTIAGNTVGASTLSGTNLVLQGGNKITLSANGQTIIFSASDQTIQTQNMVSVQGSTGAVVFSNSNGISFGGNASTITANHELQYTSLTSAITSNAFPSANTTKFAGTGTSVTGLASLTLDSLGLKFNGTGLAGTGTTFAGANISASMTMNSNGLNLSASVAAPGAAAESNAVNLLGANTAGNTTATGSTLGFSGVNITLSGTNNSQIVFSGNPAQTLQTQSRFNLTAAGNSTSGAGGYILISSGVMTLAGGNNVTLSQDGNAITISGGAAGAADGINAMVVNAGASTASTTLTLSNSNNVSFGLNAGVITATASFSQTSQSAIKGFGVSNTGQTAGNTGLSTGVDWVLAGSQSITLSQSTVGGGPNTVWFQHPAWITTYVAQTVQPVAWSGSGGSSNFSTLNFSNASNISFSNSGGSIQVLHNLAGTSTGSQGANVGISMTQNSSGLNLSITAPAPVAQTTQTLSMAATSNTTGNTSGMSVNATQLTLRGDGIVSVGYSTSAGGSSVIFSATQSNQAFSAGAASSVFQTLIFQDTQNLSFSNNAGSIRVNHNLAGTSTGTQGANITLAMTHNSSGLNLSASVAAQSTQPVAWSGSGGSSAFSTLNFSNASNFTFSNSGGSVQVLHNLAGTSTGFAGNNASGSITLNSSGINLSISVAAPGAAAENNWMTLLGANVSGNSSASGSTIGLSGINMTLSGTNNSQIVMSVPATSSLVGTSGISVSTNGSTIYVYPTASDYHWRNMPPINLVTHAGLHVSGASASKRPMLFDVDMAVAMNGVSSVRLMISRSSGVALQMTYGVAFYSFGNQTSLALISSTTNSISIQSSASWSGVRALDITGLGALSLTPGAYKGALYFSASNNAASLGDFYLIGGQSFAALNGWLSAGANQTGATQSTLQLVPMDGVYSNTTAGFPANIARSEIYGQGDATVNNLPFIQILRAWT
jgi:hypothetical protein